MAIAPIAAVISSRVQKAILPSKLDVVNSLATGPIVLLNAATPQTRFECAEPGPTPSAAAAAALSPLFVCAWNILRADAKPPVCLTSACFAASLPETTHPPAVFVKMRGS